MSLLRDSSKKQLDKLNKTIKKSGGDIQDKTKSKKEPNTEYLDNPFDSKRKVDTYETFTKTDNKVKTKASNVEMFENFSVNESKKKEDKPEFEKWFNKLDPHIKGSVEDKLRPMFVNLPNKEDRPPYDILRQGKSLKIGENIGTIKGIENGSVVIDVIDDKTKEISEVKLSIKEALKKLKKDK